MRAGQPLIRVPLDVRRSSIDGRGVFAGGRIRARRKLGELGGELIDQSEADRRARRRRRIAIVELDGKNALDASVGGTVLRFVNHSCRPNAFIRIIGAHVEFYALRAIRRGEEITCDYGETQHAGTLRCNCGVPGCETFL